MQELMAYFHSNFMALLNGKLRVYSYVHFSMESVAYPSNPDLRNTLHTRRMVHGVLDFINHLWINSVEETRKYSFAGFQYNPEDGYSD